MGEITTLVRRVVFLAPALFLAVLLTGFVLGVTAYIDIIIRTTTESEVRARRQMLISLLQRPSLKELERLADQRGHELIGCQGMDKPQYVRITPMILNTLTLDLRRTQSPEVAMTYMREEKPIIMLIAIFAVLIVFGWSSLFIMITRHAPPQIVPYVVASLIRSIPSAILTYAEPPVLEVRHDFPTRGNILADTRQNETMSQWWVLPLGFLIAMVSLAFVLLGLTPEKVVGPVLMR